MTKNVIKIAERVIYLHIDIVCSLRDSDHPAAGYMRLKFFPLGANLLNCISISCFNLNGHFYENISITSHHRIFERIKYFLDLLRTMW